MIYRLGMLLVGTLCQVDIFTGIGNKIGTKVRWESKF